MQRRHGPCRPDPCIDSMHVAISKCTVLRCLHNDTGTQMLKDVSVPCLVFMDTFTWQGGSTGTTTHIGVRAKSGAHRHCWYMLTCILEMEAHHDVFPQVTDLVKQRMLCKVQALGAFRDNIWLLCWWCVTANCSCGAIRMIQCALCLLPISWNAAGGAVSLCVGLADNGRSVNRTLVAAL